MNEFLKKLSEAKCWVKDLEKQWRISIRMDEKFQKNQFYTKSQQTAVAILS